MRRLKLCPQCYAYHAIAVKECHHCGYDFRQSGAIEKSLSTLEHYKHQMTSADLERLRNVLS